MKKYILLLTLALSMAAQTKFTAPAIPATTTVSALPTASSWTYGLMWVSDGASATDCTSGSGSTKVLCYSNGSAWASVGGGGSGSAPYSDWQKQTSAITQDGTDKTVYTTTVTAGAIGAGKCLEGWFISQHTSGTSGIGLTLWIGGTSYAINNSNQASQWFNHFLWCNDPGSTSSQQLTFWDFTFGDSVANLFARPTAGVVNTSAVDTTASVIVKLTTNADSSNTYTGIAWSLAVK